MTFFPCPCCRNTTFKDIASYVDGAHMVSIHECLSCTSGFMIFIEEKEQVYAQSFEARRISPKSLKQIKKDGPNKKFKDYNRFLKDDTLHLGLAC